LHLSAARRAPRRPQIDEHSLPAQIGKPYGFARGRFQFKAWREETLLGRGDLPKCGRAGFVCADENPGETQGKNEKIHHSTLRLLHYAPFSATLIWNISL
jgi:hypothetical protein